MLVCCSKLVNSYSRRYGEIVCKQKQESRLTWKACFPTFTNLLFKNCFPFLSFPFPYFSKAMIHFCLVLGLFNLIFTAFQSIGKVVISCANSEFICFTGRSQLHGFFSFLPHLPTTSILYSLWVFLISRIASKWVV